MEITILIFLIVFVMLKAAAAAEMNPLYRLAGLRAITSPPAETTSGPSSKGWSIQAGVYTPRQLVHGFAPLLDTVVHHLGPDPPGTKPARAALLDNVAANLATDTREASLPLPADISDISRQEVRSQARRIGHTLVKWARNYTGGPYDPDLVLRSPCEGHLLTPPNVDLMFGRRSQPHLMQLFNEYMHQMVLLRDALLPFQNYEEVPIPVDGKTRGIRHLEAPRERFLTTVLTKHATQFSMISLARALLAPGLPNTKTGGYGFQYAHGLVLPAVLAGGETPFHLLRYISAKIDDSSTQDSVLFDYEFSDYYAAPRVEIPSGQSTELNSFPSAPSVRVQNMSLGLRPAASSPSIREIELRLEFDNGKCAAVDVGQIARGHRYSYFASQAATDTNATGKSAIVHNPEDLLLHTERGLMTAKNGGFHVIHVEDTTLALALLGKLYPENVVLLPKGEGVAQAENAGKGFEPKFVIWGGVERGGLKGVF